jgi:hypothetical protein
MTQLCLCQFVVRTVAQRLVGAVLASAKIHGFALPAGAPVITLACLYVDFVRGFLGDMGIHGQTPVQ